MIFDPALIQRGARLKRSRASPRLKKNIGDAMLPVEYSAAGTRFEIDAPGGVRGAVVVPMPFIDPKKAIAK